MLQKPIEELLNKQALIEAESSNIYLSMASWTEVKGLPGIAEFLYSHADEERQHMLKLVKYINERGGVAKIPALPKPESNFKSFRQVFEKLHSHEVLVSQEINVVVDACLKHKDYTTHNFMQWYVAEQIEEEALAKLLLDKLGLIGDDRGGLYLFDRDISSISKDRDN